MAKKRVHELARELGLENKELMQRLGEMGIEVKSSLSTLEDSVVARLKQEPAAGGKQPADDKTVDNTAGAAKRAAGNAGAAGKGPQNSAPDAGKGLQNKTPAGGDKKRSGERSRNADGRRNNPPRYDRGPGLVDRVPSRPPDKRFMERPLKVDLPGQAQGARQQQPPRSAAPAVETTAEAGGQGQAPSAGQQPAGRGETGTRAGERQPSGTAETGSRVREQRPAGARDNRAPLREQKNTPGAGDVRRTNRVTERPAGAPEQQGRTRDNTARPEYVRNNGSRTAGGQAGGTGNSRPEAGRSPGRYNGGRLSGGAGTGQGRPSGGAGQGRSFGAGQGRPSGGTGQGRPRPDQLKVPKVPQEIKAISDKVKADKTRGKQDKLREATRQAPARGRREHDEHQPDRKMRPGQRKKGYRPDNRQQVKQPPAPVEKKPVVIGESVTVQELAEKMKKSPAEVIKKLMMLGVLATINQEIDSETATIVAGEFGFEVEIKIHLDAEALLEQEPEEDPALLQPRPSVVTVMGHVDHGKTSLLDAIRETNVTATEAGGITQHIGAYQVEHNNKKITFVDTPGHEAFTAMRARGAQVTDIAILVVAADDGVMPQTVEAINHARAAGVPIIVAINKMDKPGANPDRVKQQLTEYGLVAEDWGGDTILVPVSAKTRQGLEDLLEMILLVSEVSDLKANPKRPGRGTVIEAELDKGRGPVATILVQNGALNIGDNVVAGTAWGRVRAMMDYKGRRIKKAGPSTPVEVLGFCEVPQAGDLFYVVPDEKSARQVAEKRTNRRREEEFKAAQPKISLDDLFKHIKEGQVKELPVVIKADVQGSVEALKQSLERLSNDEVKVNIIHGGVGAISENDIMLASASNAIVIGFNVRPDINALRASEMEKVDIRMYRVIYDAIGDVKAALSGLLDPEYREVVLGRAEVRKTFKVSRLGTIAGCYVVDGKLQRDAGIRVIRDGVVIHEGKLDSLKRFKDDVREVVQGYECGLTLEKFNEIREGDYIEAFTTEAVKRELA
ncbi:translation initiation factor IF-2 [Desulfotomaculum copahuensis]|uniref:Translation initiation factor IF-2 n=1 Tax=Desulfotomaculum copahuensis TaxID=1838280 RepID=A0A1B7LHY5_9FIRM|nr:translation initiation factor IF-2 [Desulfotomaculum copahuensis]OAT85868.1 translation initiation factor IF-2 [Desulfotomaculum copahuensis]